MNATPSGSNNFSTVFAYVQCACSYYLMLNVDNSGKLLLMEYANPNRRELTINNMTTPDPLEKEVWHHILIAVNKTGENKLFLNGTEVASTPSTMLDLYP